MMICGRGVGWLLESVGRIVGTLKTHINKHGIQIRLKKLCSWLGGVFMDYMYGQCFSI